MRFLNHFEPIPFRYEHLPRNTESIWPNFWGAFSGAFFAFIFGLASYYLIKRYERFIRHRDAIVKLERALNDALDSIGINKRAAINIGHLLRTNKLTFNRLINFELPPEAGLDLCSGTLINDFYSYERFVHRINADIGSMNYALTRFEDIRISGQPLAQENLNFLATRLEHELIKNLIQLDDNTKTLLCHMRLYIDKLIGRNLFLYANTNTKWDIKITSDEILHEKMVLEKEISLAPNRK